jgi:hypothetical protein
VTQAPETPRAPDIGRRTLTPFGYAVAVVVPIVIAAIGITILHFNYDPEDNVEGQRVPILTSSWIPGQPSDGQTIAGELDLGADGCVELTAADGATLTPVWPSGWEATVQEGQLRLYDPERAIVARSGDQVQMTGGTQDVGAYAGRPCAPTSGEVSVVQSEVTATRS